MGPISPWSGLAANSSAERARAPVGGNPINIPRRWHADPLLARRRNSVEEAVEAVNRGRSRK